MMMGERLSHGGTMGYENLMEVRTFSCDGEDQVWICELICFIVARVQWHRIVGVLSKKL